MKTKILISNACAAIIVALSFVGCSDYDNGFTDKEIAFQEAFKKEFGEIDPEQDWNLATRGTLHVDFNKETNVKIYSANPIIPGSVLMANYNVSSPTDLGFDMPEGTEEVFVQVISDKKMLVSGYYDVINGVVEGGDIAEDNINLNVSYGDLKYLSVYDPEGNRKYKLQMLNNMPKSPDDLKAPDTWKVGDMRQILGKDGVFEEGKHNWERYIKPGFLENNVMYTIQEGGGQMSVTLEYYNTNNPNNTLAYFYWFEENPPSEDDITLYCLIDKATMPSNGYVKFDNWGEPTNLYGENNLESFGDNTEFQGTTFPLVYWGDGEASLEFPGGIHIGFALIQERIGYEEDENGNIIKEATGRDNDSDGVWFSLQEMNIPSTAWESGDLFYNQNFATAATFRVGGKTILGFEDCPTDKGSDLNDLMFWIQGDYIEEIPELFPDSETEQSWILTYEDLGNSLDWDYNDIVLKVAHVAGQPYIKITPLAAGGTLASYVKLNGTNIMVNGQEVGEIHQLLDPTVAPTASGNYTPINADSRNDGTPIQCDFKDYYSDSTDDDGDGEGNAIEGLENAFSMTVLGSVKQMGGITLHVIPADGSNAEETVIAYSLENKGKAPEVICLPGSWTWEKENGNKLTVYQREWRWPAELQNIDLAYTEFKDWAANHKTNREWYKKDPVMQYCVDGKFDEKIDEITIGNILITGPYTDGTKLPSQDDQILTIETTGYVKVYIATADFIPPQIEIYSEHQGQDQCSEDGSGNVTIEEAGTHKIKLTNIPEDVQIVYNGNGTNVSAIYYEIIR